MIVPVWTLARLRAVDRRLHKGNPPKGVISVGLDSLNRETFFLNQQFFYRVTADAK